MNLNRFIGLLLFVISLSIYFITLSPTVNFWDCGEFISCGYKLQIGHAPGAPFYLLLVRVVSLLALSEQSIALVVNCISAVSAAGTVMFLYFSLVLLIKKVIQTRALVTTFSAFIGALTFSFTDSFWYSAVEAEVYSLSLLLSALCIWITLKFDTHGFKKDGSRWIVLVFFILGISIGVHLLNLLILPVVVMIVGRHVVSGGAKRWFLLVLVSLLLVFVLYYGIVLNGLLPARYFELLFVNVFEYPKHSGLIFFAISVYSILFIFVFYTRKRHPIVHFSIVCFLSFMIGYSSYATILIRSNSSPSINLNAPDNVFSFDSYINRKQYGEHSLKYGALFNGTATSYKDVYSYRYNKSSRKYENYKSGSEPQFNASDCVVFPRMISAQKEDVEAYEVWCNKDFSNPQLVTYADNIAFFLRYQIGHMYLRYLFWNFCGKQNDEQGHGDLLSGGWRSGVDLVDSTFFDVGHLKHPDSQNRSSNLYYCIPFFCAILGFIFLLGRGKEGVFWTVMLSFLFLMTGVMITVYLNQGPFEPRERDYTFLGSFYAFSFFIGFGVLACFHLLQKMTSSKTSMVLLFVLLLLVLPILLLIKNYEDHDRSNRYLALDFAKSYLNLCDKNAILFTYGDNDTYPLWYVQEVEGYRADVKVINIGLLAADWYINQIQTDTFNHVAVKFAIDGRRYIDGDLDYVPVLRDNPVGFRSAFEWINATDDSTRIVMSSGRKMDYLESSKLLMGSQSKAELDFKKSYLLRHELALLDIIGSNYEKRSIFFTSGTPKSAMCGCEPYLSDFCFVRKLNFSGEVLVDIDRELTLFLTEIELDRSVDGWYDATCRRAFRIVGYRRYSNGLLNRLIMLGRIEDALLVANKILNEYPPKKNFAESGSIQLMRMLCQLEMTLEVKVLLDGIVDYRLKELLYWNQLGHRYSRKEFNYSLSVIKMIGKLCQDYGLIDYQHHMETTLSEIGMNPQ